MELREFKHGEAIFLEIEKPTDFDKFDKVKLDETNSVAGKLIVANSETSGNHHVLEVSKDTDVRSMLEELYINSPDDLEVSCVHPGRHDAITLPKPQAGHVWVRVIAQEYDYLAEESRNVAD